MWSCWSLPVWCPQEASVLVPPTWALGVKWKQSVWLSQEWPTGPPWITLAPHTHWKHSETNPQLERTSSPPLGQASTTRQFRTIRANLATDAYCGEWEPALEPRYSGLTHQGAFRPSHLSFFNCCLFRALSKESRWPKPLNWRCGLFGLVTSTYHGLSSGGRGTAAVPECRASHGNTCECGQWWGYLQLAGHFRRLAALALRDTAEGPYPRTFGGPRSCCTGWLLFCWRPWRGRCMCCWSEDHRRCTLSPFQHTLPEVNK